jgi:hypothetical protein
VKAWCKTSSITSRWELRRQYTHPHLALWVRTGSVSLSGYISGYNSDYSDFFFLDRLPVDTADETGFEMLEISTLTGLERMTLNPKP